MKSTLTNITYYAVLMGYLLYYAYVWSVWVFSERHQRGV